MAVTYQKAEPEVVELAGKVAKRYHADLVEAEANIGILMASSVNAAGEPVPAVKLHGVACAATVRIVSYKDRVAGKADAEILIDANMWAESSEDRRIALIDHELYHLEVQRDTEGQIKTDDAFRPKFKMRKHDVDFGWFHAIAQRHGDSSYEVIQAKAFADEYGQLYFGWSKPPEGHEVLPAEKASDGDVLAALNSKTPEQVHKAITTTAKMLEVRDSLKKLKGDKYAADIEPVKQLIRDHAKRIDEPNLLAAAMDLMQDPAVEHKHGTVMALTAAAVELAEEKAA